MRKTILGLMLAGLLVNSSAETLEIPNERVRYALTNKATSPKYLLIVMPGGHGKLALEKNVNNSVSNIMPENFLIRTRDLMADEDIIVAATDATHNPDHILDIIKDIKIKYPDIKTYLAGTSRSVLNTRSLSTPLDGIVEGFIHSASHISIDDFDTRNFKSRHLLAHHIYDQCPGYGSYGSEKNSKKYGTELILMKGGYNAGPACQGMSYHGFLGIEQSITSELKKWIKR